MIKVYKLKKNILSEKSTVGEAIKCLNKSQEKICFITKNKKLLGVLTDGDIRRILFKYSSLDLKIRGLYTKKYLFCSDKTNLEEAKKKFEKFSFVTHLPVINKNKTFLGAFSKQQLINNLEFKNEVLILAGGQGKRLLPITDHIPKPMINIMGKPFLESLLYSLKISGFKKINISVNYLKEVITNYFGNGDSYDLSIKYFSEKRILGTAGPLFFMKKIKTNKPILVINGDVYTNAKFENIIRFHTNEKNFLTVCTHFYENQIPYGVINKKKKKTKSKELITEKPIYTYSVNSGIYVIEPSLLKLIKKNIFLNMNDFINNVYKKNKKIGFFKIHENLVDIGNYENYYKTKQLIENDKKS